MRIAVSNIAWDVPEDEAMAKLFQKHGIDAIDIAPGKYFPNLEGATDKDVTKVKSWWAERGIEITGMQSLLFGTSGLNVFGSASVQKNLLKHLEAVCSIAGRLESKKLVFGSPKNRDKGDLTDAAAHAAALDFFGRLGDIATDHGVLICLEPNPPVYGCNFMINSAETGRVVEVLCHPSVKMQFDTGAVTINNEDPFEVLARWLPFLGHFHISEPALVVVGDGATDHSRIAAALKTQKIDRLLSIEMVATREESHFDSIERAIIRTKQAYLS